MIALVFNCTFMPVNYMSPALAAHISQLNYPSHRSDGDRSKGLGEQ
jgi:hypothetical protein